MKKSWGLVFLVALFSAQIRLPIRAEHEDHIKGLSGQPFGEEVRERSAGSTASGRLAPGMSPGGRQQQADLYASKNLGSSSFTDEELDHHFPAGGRDESYGFLGACTRFVPPPESSQRRTRELLRNVE